jgi:PD-(D/E)XK endonuclease
MDDRRGPRAAPFLLATGACFRIGGGENGVKKFGTEVQKTNKQLGEWAELCFMARAADRGLNVSKPHGDSASYDVGVEQNGRFLRIQVKSTTFRRKGSYTCNILGAKRERYGPGQLDFFAVYLVPIDLWYIIPFELVAENLSLNLTPRKGHKFAQYMEAWNLLRGRRKKARSSGRKSQPEPFSG